MRHLESKHFNNYLYLQNYVIILLTGINKINHVVCNINKVCINFSNIHLNFTILTKLNYEFRQKTKYILTSVINFKIL